LKATQQQLITIRKMASLANSLRRIAHEKQNPFKLRQQFIPEVNDELLKEN
jgi:hypothetical protein